MTYRVLQYPADGVLLRRRARPVMAEEFGTEPFLEFLKRLSITMREAGGVGLASTQVAESGAQPWAVFAFCVQAIPGLDLRLVDVICNPVIVASSKEQITEDEGCLSFSSVPEPMAAPRWMVLDAQNAQGELFRCKLEGPQARVAFHETRHLSGTLMIDAMSPMKRRLFLRRVAEARKGMGEA